LSETLAFLSPYLPGFGLIFTIQCAPFHMFIFLLHDLKRPTYVIP
jgi:hypothetical protein